jgi:hypothetical protein
MLSLVRVLVLVWSVFIGGHGYAESSDEKAISGLLHAMFDKPDLPLAAAPLVIVGDHAIADWAQGEMGGRALLRRKPQGWTLVLCAGDAIKTRDALLTAGVPAGDAARLERDLATAEAGLSQKDVAMFSRFEGLVTMDEGATHGSTSAVRSK